MGGPLVDCSAEGVSSSSCLSRSTCEKAGFEHSSCALPEDEKSEAGIASVKDDLVVKEISLALAEVMRVYNDNDDEETDLSEDSDENGDSLSVESDSADDLVDIDTEVVTSSALTAGNASKSSTGNSEIGNSSTNGTELLVSAMKGSRAKRGIVTKLSVSWAPDVYDPPVTSDSHTVKPHQRSSRKSHYKYKPPKGSSSSSRTSSGSKKDKKHSHHSSSSSSKRDKKPSHRSSNGGSSRTDTSDPHHRKAYGSSITSRTDTSVPEYHKLSPWQPPASAAVEEAMPPVPVLKAMEQIKRSSSCCKEPPISMKAMEQIKRSSSCCKEPPISMLSRQFVAAKYKGMFSFLSQNQLAS
ncbi:hypothetical protein CFC21_036679 [Triticum aestivum]|uniref:Uncharacterized protein n=3 Tax=Triticum TaxID=4564 RepID=A0A9R0VNA7_TRITD|nr:uncharacterized serine-rich protein C215.13-like [Triticum aestivum]KAF7024312.1 hypothetical protein CFC21_036679 [Triticum aestivum]VAH65267.1 unnamed protein product [Triticum turgidum subsp. durum]